MLADYWTDTREDEYRYDMFRAHEKSVELYMINNFGVDKKKEIYNYLKSLVGLFDDLEIYDIATEHYTIDEWAFYAWLGLCESWDELFERNVVDYEPDVYGDC